MNISEADNQNNLSLEALQKRAVYEPYILFLKICFL